RQRGIACRVHRALGIIAPLARSHAHVLDVLDAVVRVCHETGLSDFVWPRNVRALVEIHQAIAAAADRGGIEVGVTGFALDIERLCAGFLDPSVAAAPLGVRAGAQHHERSQQSVAARSAPERATARALDSPNLLFSWEPR